MASKRGYLTQAELAEYADITITDSTEADDQISQAEELVDNYVGYQNKFIDFEIAGVISAGGVNNVTLDPVHTNSMQADYLKGCFIEILGGAGEGQREKITAQTYAGVVTFETNLSTALTTTSFYRIYQLGVFPREQDVRYDGLTTNKYYKSIPEKVRRAVAAQVEYIIQMGTSYFTTDKSDMASESIGDYSYSKGSGGTGSLAGANKLIAPKARILLRGIVNRGGVLL